MAHGPLSDPIRKHQIFSIASYQNQNKIGFSKLNIGAKVQILHWIGDDFSVVNNQNQIMNVFRTQTWGTFKLIFGAKIQIPFCYFTQVKSVK